MKTYDIYLDSGPMRKKTYVNVPALTGCIARGDTTDEAIERTPDAIRAFLRFLARHGERVDPDAPFRVRVAAHITDSVFPANGIGFLPADAKPLAKAEANKLMDRLGAIHGDLRRVTAGLTARQLDAKPARGRSLRDIMRHMCVEGAYLRGVSGASRIQRLVEQGELDARDALDQLLTLERARLDAMSAQERREVIMRGQQQWSARSAVRRMLEHTWEHYVEVATRLGKTP